MTGTVRSIRYNENTDRSMLHIEAEPLSVETRNRILGEVFGMQPEAAEDELPFQVLDDEISDLAEDGSRANALPKGTPSDGESADAGSPDDAPVLQAVTLDADDAL
jgi:hypothetical protein